MTQIYNYTSFNQSSYVTNNVKEVGSKTRKITFDGKTTTIEGYEQIDIIGYLINEVLYLKNKLNETQNYPKLSQSLSEFEKDWECESDAIWDTV